MRKRLRGILLAMAVAFVLAFIALIAFTPGRSKPLPPLPNPNGYDDFLQAGKLVTGDIGSFDTLDDSGLRVLISTNTDSLRLLRLGLTRACSVPTEAALTNFAGMMSDLPELKSLSHLLIAEGRLAEMEHRSADAARSYLDSIHLGSEASRGGFMINRLVCLAFEARGCNALAKLVPTLDCEQARSIMTQLEAISAASITWDEVQRTEAALIRQRTINPIARLTSWWQTRTAKRKARAKDDRILAHLSLLATELALRCYRCDQGTASERLDLLVPKYLHGVPKDPFSGRPLLYRAQGTNWLLYSVGPDGKDDGGSPAGRGSSGKGDLFFDSSW